jgi:hypothetical protein
MKLSSTLMVLGSALLFGLFLFPLWHVELGAPQYPKGLGMHINIDGIVGYTKHDIRNIDGLNHYIGMKTLPTKEEMWEFTIFPIVIGGMAILGIIIGLFGFFKNSAYKWFIGWFVIMSILGVMGMIDFNAWMTDYGTNLDPNAIMQMTDDSGNPLSYKPPLFGTKDILNFTAVSYPSKGGILLGIGMLLTFISFFVGKKFNAKIT